MFRATLKVRLICSIVVVLTPGCRRDAPTTAAPVSKPAPAEGARSYGLKGVVRRVDQATGGVTISHESIPGFMNAMTMPFTLKDHALLDDVRVGDEVEGTLRVDYAAGEVKDYELTDLVVSRPAPAGPLKLDVPAIRRLQAGDEVPDFAMTGQDGKAFRLSDLRGEVVALTFIYTRCPLPDFCPRLDAKFAEASERASVSAQRSARLRFLSVSFDPEHDTPEVLARHAEARGAKPPLWSFAVASHDELAKVAGPLGLTYGPGKDEVMHNLVVAVVGPDGRLVRVESGAAARAWGAVDLVKTMDARIPETNR